MARSNKPFIPVARSYLERKESWARRMIERGLGMPQTRSDHRLPPGQHWTTSLPVLDLGIHPQIPLDQWRLEISGHVETAQALTWDALQQLPRREITADFHCVTTWSVRDCRWSGVPIISLLDLVRPLATARCVLFTAHDGYTTNVDIEILMDPNALLATHLNGSPITLEHGAPARVILPRLYAWKGAKFVRAIEFLLEDECGYWERRGYSNTADPWTNDRFAHEHHAW